MPADIISYNSLLTGGFAGLPGTPLTTVGASASSTGIDLGAGGALSAGSALEMVTRINLTNAVQTSGGGTITFNMDHSSDNSTWQNLAGTARGANDVITLSATAQTGEFFIFWRTIQRYVRLTMVVGASGVGNSITFTAAFMPSMP